MLKCLTPVGVNYLGGDLTHKLHLRLRQTFKTELLRVGFVFYPPILLKFYVFYNDCSRLLSSPSTLVSSVALKSAYIASTSSDAPGCGPVTSSRNASSAVRCL